MLIRKLSKDNVNYWIGLPTYPVNLFVEYFMVCHGAPTFREEYIFPHNHAEIFFNLGDVNYGVGSPKNSGFFFRETVVSGLRNSRLTIKPGKIFSLAGVRFNIFGFQNIFYIPSDEFTNRNFDATEVWDKNLLLLHEQLMEIGSPTVKITFLQDWIKSKIQLHNLQEAKVWNKLSLKLKNSALPLPRYLSSAMGYSHKHTIKLFKEKCGLPPKMIQRIYRFNNVLMHAQTPGMNWTSLCHEAGYSDQSHFIKDFKQFTGLTPKMFLAHQPKDWMLLKESR
jgi:AraC-like DNA-binding protein